MTAPRRPDFFLVGAAKSGTTSLAAHLDAHPGVWVSKPKEPNYYAFPPGQTPTCNGPASPDALYEKLLKYTVTSPEEYAALFAEAAPDQAAGEASVRYLYEPTAAGRIATDRPDAKIVALLRDPVERAYSHYHMAVKWGLEPLSFSDALAAEDQRVDQGWGWDWHYTRVGRYGEQLARYFERFGPDRVLVLMHADLQADPESVWRRLCEFLAIDPAHRPDFERRHLVGKTPRVAWARRLLWEESPAKSLAKAVLPEGLRRRISQGVNRANTTRVAPLAPGLAAELRPRFAEDTRLLADLMGRTPPW